MKVQHLIVGGCSFSADGIGGCPPDHKSNGGCSYIQDPDYVASEPNNWVGFLARKLSVQSLVNLAASSHGNILTSYSIFELLKKYNYDVKNSLIIFNLTDPFRVDIPCDFYDKKADENIPWDKDILSHSYQKIQHCVSESMEKYTSESVRFLLEYLKLKGFKFYFLLMNDYTDHKYLGPIVNEFQDHLIAIDPGPSMMEFAISTKNTVSNTDFHPNLNGHKLIAEQIYSHICNYNNYL
jgi:hypothetical protein